MKTKTRKIVIAAMLAALCCVATMVIKIPLPLGYVNVGDMVVLLTGWLLSPLYGALAAGLGTALADVLSPYAIYAPATFVIKSVMALIAHFGFRLVSKKMPSAFGRIISGIVAEIWMIAGYFLYEGILYGFAGALGTVPGNGVQGAVGLLLGILLIKIFEKYKIGRLQ